MLTRKLIPKVKKLMAQTTPPFDSVGPVQRRVDRLPAKELARILEKAETDACYALLPNDHPYERGDVKRRAKWEQRASDVKKVKEWLASQPVNTD